MTGNRAPRPEPRVHVCPRCGEPFETADPDPTCCGDCAHTLTAFDAGNASDTTIDQEDDR